MRDGIKSGVLAALLAAAACGSYSDAGWDRPAPGREANCSAVHVVNQSWERVVLYSQLARVGDVEAGQTVDVQVCSLDGHQARIRVDATGGRYDYWVFADGAWDNGQGFYLLIANQRAHSYLRVSGRAAPNE